MSFQTKITLLFVSLFLTASAFGTMVEPGLTLPPKIDQLTTLGQNRQPLLHGDKGFYFISRGRSSHKDSQIYYKNFRTGREQRITHQRGHIIGGIWLKEGQLVYASSTDEDKESPLLLRQYMDRVPAEIDSQFFFHLNLKPAEIYSSSLKGLDILRLSNHMGFDAFPAYLPKNKRLFFSRFENNKINIYSQKMKSKALPRLAMETYGHDLGLQLSPKEDQFVWYRFSPDFKSSQLMTSNTKLKQQKYLTLDSGIHWTPSWHPKQTSILFSAKKNGDKNYNLYEISIADRCERKITSTEGDEFYPVVNRQGTKILFTGTQTGQEQIHQMDYPPIPFDCPMTLKAANVATAKPLHGLPAKEIQ